MIYLAFGAPLDAVWDLYARVEGKPVWRLLAEMSPEQIVSAVDFRYIEDGLTREEALSILRAGKQGQTERLHPLEIKGYPAYTTAVGLFRFSDLRICWFCQEALRGVIAALQLSKWGSLEGSRR